MIFLHAAVRTWRRLSTSAMRPIKGVLRSCDWRIKKNKIGGNKGWGRRDKGQ